MNFLVDCWPSTGHSITSAASLIGYACGRCASVEWVSASDEDRAVILYLKKLAFGFVELFRAPLGTVQ